MTHRTRLIVYAIIALGTVLSVWVLIHGMTNRVQHAEQGAVNAELNAAKAKAGVSTLAQQVRDLGGIPKVKPSQLPGPKGDTGDRGPRGQTGATGGTGPAPSREQVLAAVTTYCSSGICAHGPTPSQVNAAIAAYCQPRNQCKGATGGVGPPGAPGASGGPGTDGQNATDAQVLDAVNAYCANHNQCQGAKGDQGNTGPQGPAGYPESFTWTDSTIPGQTTTYVCKDPDGDHAYDCTSTTSTP